MQSIKYWVNDKTRMCSMTMGAQEAADNVTAGFRNVTAEEQDDFRAETKALKDAKKATKGNGKKSESGLVVNATAAELAQVVKDFNK